MAKYRFEQIAFNSTEKKIPNDHDRLLYIGLEHLDSGSLRVTRWGSDVPIKGEKLVMHKGDVLFGKRNAYLRRAAIAPHDGTFSAHGMVLRPNEQIVCKEFFPHFIASDYFFDEAIRISVGSLSPTVNWKDLRYCEFELPSLEEQKRLAKALWAVNYTIETYKNLLKKTDELVKSQFIVMFGNPLLNEMKWPVQKMKKVAPSVPYSGKVSNNGNRYWLLNLDMVESNTGRILDKVYVSMDEIGLSTTTFSSEYVLFSKLRPYLNKVVIPDDSGYATTELIPMRPDPKYLKQMYLAQLLRGDEFLSFISTQVSGTKMPRVTMNVFWDFEVMLPPLDLQEQFVAFVRQSDKSKLFLQRAIEVILPQGCRRMRTPIK